MTRPLRTPAMLLLLLPALACDTAQENKSKSEASADKIASVNAEAKGNAAAMIEEGKAAEGDAVDVSLDLEKVVAEIEDGKIKTAAELETGLAADGSVAAKVDTDGDGKPDDLRVVEHREGTATTFEIHAIAASEDAAPDDADAEGKVEVETAPLVATLRFDAKADVGVVEAKAAFDADFAAEAELDANATAVTHTFSGISVTAEGRMEVAAGGNAFVAWAFATRRPIYVAAVFRIEAHHERAPDPCWPPGHCKHNLWKARGELPPGQQREVDARGDHGWPEADEHGHGHDKHGNFGHEDKHGSHSGHSKSKSHGKPAPAGHGGHGHGKSKSHGKGK